MSTVSTSPRATEDSVTPGLSVTDFTHGSATFTSVCRAPWASV